MENLEILKRVLSEKGVDVNLINEDSDLKDLGLDSLDTVEAMMNIEEELNIEFSTDELANSKTVGDVLKLIQEKVK
ncbi:MAG: phosphopantetheine-binding protein [Bacilli bacterium]|nr:phosphopantetheine-binding protein [Bacilli bacterium]